MTTPIGKWKAVRVVLEYSPVDIGGFNPWDHDWHELSRDPIDLPHPSFPNQQHRVWAYELHTPTGSVIFAAGEVSPGAWSFYVPETQ